MSYWRNKARPIIAQVLAETEGQPESEIKRQRGAMQRGPSPEQAARIAEICAHNEAVDA